MMIGFSNIIAGGE